jgi:hypothetical protein
MNLEHVGDPIAMIFDSDNKKDKGRLISVQNDKHKVAHFIKEIQVSKPSEYIQLIPNKDHERDIRYITGASGSGKSFFTKKYLEQYHKMFPKRMVYLFSSLTDDKTLDAVKYIKRIKLTPELIEDDITAKDFADALVIFDDTDCLTNKAMKMKVNGIMTSILETGRHFNTSIIYTSHLATAGNDTKRILNECNSITIFPASLGGRSLKYLLEGYLGLDKAQIKRIKKMESRSVTIQKSFPMVVIGEKEMYVSKVDD